MLKWIGMAIFTLMLFSGQIQAQETEAKNEQPTAKELDAALQAAAQLAQEKKLDEARAAYKQIIQSAPASASAAQAQQAIARTYLAEAKYPEGIKQLQALLADADSLPPKLQEEVRADLSNAQLVFATKLTEGGKPESAIAILKELAGDKQASPAAVRLAFREIARNHLAAKQEKEAIAAYQELLKRPAVGEPERLEDIISLTALDPAAHDALQTFIDEHPAASADLLAHARFEIGDAYRRQGDKAKALSVFDELATNRKTPSQWIRAALIGKATIALTEGDNANAVALYRNVVSRPVGDWSNASIYRLQDLNRIVELSPGADVTAEFAAFLSQINHINYLGLIQAIPGNDVLRIGLQPNVDYLVAAYKVHLRQTKGRATEQDITSFRDRLTKGGKSKPFATSAFSKKVAGKISKDAPLGAFLKPLLLGDHQAAAQIAWNHARLAETDEERAQWLNAIVLAIRCHDQQFGGRDEAFVKWLSAAGDETNPILDLVGEQPLEFEPSEEEFAKASAQLNAATSPAQINEGNLILASLPKNDVLRIGLQTAAAAAQDHQKYQWRTLGKASPAQTEAVASQLAKGGEEKFFVVSPASKKLAGAILDDAPLADYLKPLLEGEHLIAAKSAWKHARLAQDIPEYQGWINAAATALRCHDQGYVRGAELVAWSRGEGVASVTPENEQALILGVFTLDPLPFSSDPEARKKALEELKKLEGLDRLSLNSLVPGNDVVLAISNMGLIPHNDNRWLIYARDLWRTQGRALPSQMEAMKKQIMEGGDARPFATTDESKKLAGSLNSKLPNYEFLKLLLEGKHQAAAQYAWEKATNAPDDNTYNGWVAAVVLATQCHDQTVAGRAQNFANWTRGTLKDANGEPVMVNPLADFLGK